MKYNIFQSLHGGSQAGVSSAWKFPRGYKSSDSSGDFGSRHSCNLMWNTAFIGIFYMSIKMQILMLYIFVCLAIKFKSEFQ